MKPEAEFRQALKDWIIAKNGKIKSEDLADDTPIIETRIISSLQLMDLILFLEKITGNPIEVEQLKPGVFRSIDTIYNSFSGVK